MKDAVIIVALICITVIQLYALSLGIDGTVMSSVIAVIAGLAGYKIHAKKVKSKA